MKRAYCLLVFLFLAPVINPVAWGETDSTPYPRAIAAEREDKTIWVGTDKGLISFHPEKDEWRFWEDSSFPPLGVNSIALGLDPGTLWLGTDSGVVLWRDGRFELMSDGLPSKYVLSVFVSREGETFAGTDRGIAKWERDKKTFVPLPDSHDFLKEPVMAIAEGAGGIWFARKRAIERLRNGKISSQSFNVFYKDFFNPGISGNLLGRYPRTLASSPDGSVWIATEGGINIVRQKGEKGDLSWDAIPFIKGPLNLSGLPSNEITSIAFTGPGDVWFSFGESGAVSGGYGIGRKDSSGATTIYTSADGLPSNKIIALSTSPGGSLWAASGPGIACFRDGHFTTFLFKGNR